MKELSIVEVPLMDMLSLSILVLFVGMYLNRKIRFLEENYLLPAITGVLKKCQNQHRIGKLNALSVSTTASRSDSKQTAP